MPKDKEQPTAEDARWLTLVREQVALLRYGVVQIVVHDARVTQIERTEKLRLDEPRA
ncbi:YezD family protein [bacterium]|nr:YezD family protein [bacterium]